MMLDLHTSILLVTFWALLLLSCAQRSTRDALRHKPWQDWLLDAAGLLVQGVGVPVLQVALVWTFFDAWKPTARGVWAIPWWQALLLNVLVVDYLYYWNHRLLHTRLFWPLHRVHHTMTALDVWGTSRNTLYSSFFINYLWVNGTFLYLLTDPSGFAAGMTLTAGLDLWRHSSLGPRVGTRSHRLLSYVLITPADHGWHHSAHDHGLNFGANFSFWDRLHRTWRPLDHAATRATLGLDDGLSVWRRLLWPFTEGDKSLKPPMSAEGSATAD